MAIRCPPRRRGIGACAGLAAVLVAAGASCARAQSPTWPAKPVRVVNPVAAGGNQDIVARAISEQLARAFGQPFVVENRLGAGATVGTRYVKAAPADGYTLLAVSDTFVRAAVLAADAGYDPVRDFAAVSLTCDVPLVLVVTPSLPVNDVRGLVALARRRPGELSSASSGVGSTGHVAAEMFARQAGVRLLHVQYKGAAPAVVDLVGGHVMLRFDQVSTSLRHIRGSRLRALGVTTLRRSALLPAVPTLDESGLPGFQDSTFNGLVAPAGTPREVLERVRAEVVRAVAGPELRKRLLDVGIELTASASIEEFSGLLQRHVTEFTRLAREAGMLSN